MEQDPPAPFRFLPYWEFEKLTTDEKVAYLNNAIAAVTRNVPVIAVLKPPKDSDKH